MSKRCQSQASKCALLPSHTSSEEAYQAAPDRGHKYFLATCHLILAFFLQSNLDTRYSLGSRKLYRVSRRTAYRGLLDGYNISGARIRTNYRDSPVTVSLIVDFTGISLFEDGLKRSI